ncbi:MAG TPA: copper homeostasis protein CutC [Candidatus Acidoferrum sp.]|nr:copper homeostasis protein CutC [Candidatus Acidoferrum sp.]
MAPQPILEITVESLDNALAAERAGADRIELCAELLHGGITPSLDAMRAIHDEVEIPIFPIVRPRKGDFSYSEKEFAAMKHTIDNARDLGMDGVVFGILLPDGRVDVERTTELVEWAKPLEVTFHRAFDQSADLFQSLSDVIATGASRILTSGGAAIAPKAVQTLQKLVSEAGDRIVVMPGSGLDASNIAEIAAKTRAKEFHSGLSTVLPYGSGNLPRFEAEIHEMKRQLLAMTSR